MTRYCTKCGAINDEMAQYCTNCQAPLSSVAAVINRCSLLIQGALTDWKALGADKKIVAGILGILVGSLGVHKFVLGYTTEGHHHARVTLLTCGVGSLIGLVEGIIYLTKSDEDFVRTYIQNKKGWF